MNWTLINPALTLLESKATSGIEVGPDNWPSHGMQWFQPLAYLHIISPRWSTAFHPRPKTIYNLHPMDYKILNWFSLGPSLGFVLMLRAWNQKWLEDLYSSRAWHLQQGEGICLYQDERWPVNMSWCQCPWPYWNGGFRYSTAVATWNSGGAASCSLLTFWSRTSPATPRQLRNRMRFRNCKRSFQGCIGSCTLDVEPMSWERPFRTGHRYAVRL